MPDFMSELDIAKLSFPEAYSMLLTVAEADASALTIKSRTQIRFGFDYHFDLQLVFNNNFHVDDKNGVIYIGKSALQLSPTFYTEIERREALTRRLLIKACVGRDPFTV